MERLQRSLRKPYRNNVGCADCVEVDECNVVCVADCGVAASAAAAAACAAVACAVDVAAARTGQTSVFVGC